MKIIAKNPAAGRDYTTTKKLEAGIVLKGHEVKSIRAGAASLKGAYVRIINNEAWLINAHITAYPAAKLDNYDPVATRKLLLKKSEIHELDKARQNGMVTYPLAIGIAGKYIKVEVGLGRSRKKQDKREVIKKRDTDRELDRRIKHSRS